MHFPTVPQLFLALPIIYASALQTPLSTSGRNIVDSNNDVVTLAGVNWPGAADAMLPEGLQYQSIDTIVSKIKELGMNVIRLTFAIEMIDDILDNGGDVNILTSLTNALGETNGTAVFQEIIKNNPQFSQSTTRLEVYKAVAQGCYDQNIYVHIDNHISKAEWCCDTDDGNAWFGDTYFDVTKWRRGLAYMAGQVADWPAVVSVGMRNELREPDDNSTLVADSYNWADWYTHMTSAASAIYAANPDLLIFFSGLNFDTDMSPIPTAASLGDGRTFVASSFEYADKIVIELHNYASSTTSCSSLESSLYSSGYNALNASDSNVKNVVPVMLTEFGFAQDSTTYNSVYASCLRTFLPSVKGGWMTWALSGSYYIRQGVQDFDETWGLLDHTWSDWRSSGAINAFEIYGFSNSGVVGVLDHCRNDY